jgi:hypothetical protein
MLDLVAKVKITEVKKFLCLERIGSGRLGDRLLSQLRVLCFGFLKDGDIGVSVLPEGKKIFVGS